MGFAGELMSNVGSHSCKATLLSVMSKAGINRDDRRVLGGHAPPGDKSVDTYSRDALAAPLLSLAKLLTCIREGTFRPDESRSGRWKTSPPLLSKPGLIHFLSNKSSIENKVVAEEDDGDGFGDDTVPDIEFQETASTDSSEQSSDDSDEDGMRAVTELLEAGEQISADNRLLTKGIDDGSKAEFPDNGIVINLVTNVAHRAKSDQKCACGTKLSELSSEYLYLEGDLRGRSLCWKQGCAPWRAAVTIVEISE
jgi:hypothetical protein